MGNQYGARCPNHGVFLVDCKGNIGICPSSGALFTFDADAMDKKRKLVLNAMGQYEEQPDWDVKHLEGDDNVW